MPVWCPPEPDSPLALTLLLCSGLFVCWLAFTLCPFPVLASSWTPCSPKDYVLQKLRKAAELGLDLDSEAPRKGLTAGGIICVQCHLLAVSENCP